MRGLIVGLGSIGRRHARNWAALDLGPLAVCRQKGSPQPEPLGVSVDVFDDLDAALNERPDIVFVTNPTSLHVEIACSAVRAGAHLFIEKPMSHTLHGLDQLIADAAARQRNIIIGYNLRFHPGLQRVRELFRAGAIGRLVSARADVGEYLPDWHPWEDYRGGYAARQALGGGPLLTLSHELDSVCWLLGAPTRVTAMTARSSALEIDTDAVAEVLLQYDDGPLASVHMDFVRRPPRRTLELVGEQGILRWEYEENRLHRYSATSSQWWVEEGDPRFERNQMFTSEMRHVAACVRGDEMPLVDAAQGGAVLAIALAAARSASSGRTIDLAAEGAPVTTWLRSLGQP